MLKLNCHQFGKSRKGKTRTHKVYKHYSTHSDSRVYARITGPLYKLYKSAGSTEAKSIGSNRLFLPFHKITVTNDVYNLCTPQETDAHLAIRENKITPDG